MSSLFFESGGIFPPSFADVETLKGTKRDKEKCGKMAFFFAKIGGLGQISPIALIF
ncbi:hypothetical protein [Hallerella porci]|uniref:hypothetical protein n=1 Tax=Hallerella porci TaxID=1945871 RepID=UPI001304EAC2|nr:hypothetical protein [Hallerella porci]